MHALIFAGGTIHPGPFIHGIIQQAEFVVAADSGAQSALQFGLKPNIVIGDFDSINNETIHYLKENHVPLIQVAAEKDETDTELAIQTVLDHGATRIFLLGATGGTRFEHSIANVLLLASFPQIDIQLIDGFSRCRLLEGPNTLKLLGEVDDLLSLFPLTAHAYGIETHNLYYPLTDATLSFGKPRGISNVFVEREIEVSLREGLLLVIHTSKDMA